MAVQVAAINAELRMGISNFEKNVRAAERRLGGLETKSRGLSRAMGKIGAVAAAGTVAAVAAVGVMAVKSVTVFSDFQKGMNEVFTLLPGISEKAMGEMAADVLDVSKKMGVLPSEVIPALYQALSAGVPQENVFSFIELATKASIGGITDLETAVDGITSVINAFGVDNVSAEKASDIMFTTVRLGKTTFDELSRSLFQVNPVAAGLGVKFEDVGASLAALTAQGVPTRVAATQIRQAMVELGKKGTKASDVFETLTGKTFKDFIKSGGTMKGAFDVMRKGADQMGVGVGDLFGSVEAGMAVIALTSESGSASFGDALLAMEDSAGATQAAFDTMDEGLARSWDKIKAQGAAAMIQLGAAVAPVVERLLDWFVKQLPSAIKFVQDTWKKWEPTVNKVVAWLGKAIPAAVKTMMDVWYSIAPALETIWGRISKAISTVVEWFSSSEGQGQIGSTIETVEGYFQGFLDYVGPIWDSISEVIDSAMKLITEIVTLAVQGIRAFWEEHGERIRATVGVVFEKISTIIQGTMDVIKGIIDTVLAVLSGDWEGAWDAMKETLSGVWTVMKATVEGAIAILKSVVVIGLDGIALAFGAVWDAVKSGVSSAWGSIVQAVTDAVNKIIGLVNDAISAVNSIPLAPDIPTIPEVGRRTGGGTRTNPSPRKIVPGSLGIYHDGGVVPGPRGQEVLAVLQAGETVIPLSGSGGGNVYVTVEGSVITERKLETVVADAVARRQRRVK